MEGPGTYPLLERHILLGSLRLFPHSSECEYRFLGCDAVFSGINLPPSWMDILLPCTQFCCLEDEGFVKFYQTNARSHALARSILVVH